MARKAAEAGQCLLRLSKQSSQDSVPPTHLPELDRELQGLRKGRGESENRKVIEKKKRHPNRGEQLKQTRAPNQRSPQSAGAVTAGSQAWPFQKGPQGLDL